MNEILMPTSKWIPLRKNRRKYAKNFNCSIKNLHQTSQRFYFHEEENKF
jgi:hypothetical protein